MEVINKLLSEVKEIMYDVVGYFLPGLFVACIISLPFISHLAASPMYAFYEIIFHNADPISFDISTFSSIPLIIILISVLVIYLLGHVPTFTINSFFKLVNLLCGFPKFIKRINKKESYVKLLSKNLTNILEHNDNFPNDLLKEKNGQGLNLDAASHFASTLSRFKSHNNLIQKYICKRNFYKSIANTFILLLMDSIISYVFWIVINFNLCNLYTNLSFIALVILLFVCSLGFYKESNRHAELKNKEMIIFLYDYYCTEADKTKKDA